jgi:hypothetical protein
MISKSFKDKVISLLVEGLIRVLLAIAISNNELTNTNLDDLEPKTITTKE